jgi:hypothetical protein
MLHPRVQYFLNSAAARAKLSPGGLPFRPGELPYAIRPSNGGFVSLILAFDGSHAQNNGYKSSDVSPQT